MPLDGHPVLLGQAAPRSEPDHALAVEHQDGRSLDADGPLQRGKRSVIDALDGLRFAGDLAEIVDREDCTGPRRLTLDDVRRPDLPSSLHHARVGIRESLVILAVICRHGTPVDHLTEVGVRHARACRPAHRIGQLQRGNSDPGLPQEQAQVPQPLHLPDCDYTVLDADRPSVVGPGRRCATVGAAVTGVGAWRRRSHQVAPIRW